MAQALLWQLLLCCLVPALSLRSQYSLGKSRSSAPEPEEITTTSTTTELEEEETKCCCDNEHYDPPQCRVFSESQLISEDKNPFKALKTLIGTRFCPVVDLFPGDGVGERKTRKAKDNEMVHGCTEPFLRDPLAELKLERGSPSGIDIRLDIPASMRFLILLGADDSESYSPTIFKDTFNKSRFQRWVQRRRGAQLMSRWKVSLTKHVFGTVTSRPVYDLWLEQETDEFEPLSTSHLRLELNRVQQVRRIDVDGRACVGLMLEDERRILLVPYEPQEEAGELTADLSTEPFPELQQEQWSLLAVPGVSDGNICCCSEPDEYCVLQPPPCSKNEFNAKLVAQPRTCAVADERQESAAEELATELAKAKRLARDDADIEESGTGPRVLYEALAHTPMNCHSVKALRKASESTWETGKVGAELRTFKAIKGGSGAGGLSGLVRDVWGRHQHIRVGSGDSCIDLMYENPSADRIKQSGCGPYQAKAAMVAIVRECFDATAAVEFANVRAWRVMAQAYIGQSSVKEALETAGYAPGESWQKLLAADVERIQQVRLAALTSDLQADRAGVWHILQRASIYAQKYFDDQDSYMANVNRKLDDVDKLFWELIEKPGDGHVYPHKYNDKEPRDIVEGAAYQVFVDDDTTFFEKIVPTLKKAGGEKTPQALSKAVHECFASLDCLEVPLLFKLMQQLDDAAFWKKVPTGWLAGLAHAPSMHPTPPSSSQFIFPRSAKDAFGKCFTSPREAVEDARTLMEKLQEQVAGKTWLRKHTDNIFQGPALKSIATLNDIEAILDEAADVEAEMLGTRPVQGALACYPTLFGSLGMEQEIRDETGYKKSKRTEDMEQVLRQCSVAPQCARLAIERLLHFNTKRWDMYAGITSSGKSYDKICNQPNPDQHSNCQLFAACFQHQLEQLCSEFPGCCGEGKEVCADVSNGTSTFSDLKTVMGY